MLTGLPYVKVPLPDLSTENFAIAGKSNDSDAVQYYSTDRLRIDMAKWIRKSLWPEFSMAASMFTLRRLWTIPTMLPKLLVSD